MKKNIVIIHYNTPSLTECLVRSINLFVKDTEIYIFDNSDVKPFTAKFDNVTIIDNTKGKYIDFKEWLKKYPDRNKSHGKVNGWGSAKHCYSVEKCMEILNENFVLLDSDILLKRDISNLYRDDLMYIGEVVTQPNSSIKRVLPFICYINVKMCLEKGVHYFDENYMHGLSYTKSNKYADRYDTGAAFYLQASKYKHEDIKYENYSVHYGHGSWDMVGDRKKASPNEWLKRNKNLYTIGADNMRESSYKEKLKKFCNDRHLNINIDSPKTIQDKINWLKVNNLSQLKIDCADKVKLHEFCKKVIDKDICTPIIKVYNSTNEINWDELPNKFVIKCNHGSGMNIIVNKSNFNKEEVERKLDRWMNTDFAFQNGYEMQYHYIDRKIFAETFLEDPTQKKSLFDYKFWCFNGVPHFFTINDGNGHGSWMEFYDMDCKRMNCKRTDFTGTPNAKVNIPSKFNEMAEYAKKLSEPFEFVRVDFYEVNGEVYLGEMTFTPGSGFFRYTDKSYDLKFGEMLKLNTTKNKKVVYTCITGGYDRIIEPKFITDGFDYVCFTDNMDLESDVWEIRPLPKETENLSQVKKQRYVKINTHKVLSEYDLSIWVDGNVELKDDLNEFIKDTLVDDCSIYVPKHPVRKCIYAEAKVVISMKKDTKENVNKQIERYSSEGFPKDYGLLQSNIILRRHNNGDCIRLMEAWFNELKDGSHRDQLSFNYVAWKNQDINFMYMDKGICYSKWFNWRAGHTKITQKKSAPVATNTSPNGSTLKRQRQAFNIMMSNRLNNRRLSTHNIFIYN